MTATSSPGPDHRPVSDRTRHRTRLAWYASLGVLVPFCLPMITQRPYPPPQTGEVVLELLTHNLIRTFTWYNPLAKLAILVAVAAPFLWRRNGVGLKVLLGYYTVSLVLVGFAQNIGRTPTYGWAWACGNTVVQLMVAAVIFWHLVSGDAVQPPQESGPALEARVGGHWWVLPLMALALLSPGLTLDRPPAPGIGLEVLTNDVALAYCMITPIIVGTLLLFQRWVHPGMLSLASLVGVVFGLLNVLVGFVLVPSAWWVGVMHLPLLVISAAGVWLGSRQQRRRRPPAAVQASTHLDTVASTSR